MPKRTDHNQSEIVAALRELGVSVVSVADHGRGLPDLVMGYRGRAYLCEIKNGKLGWKLTPAQKKFRSTWNGGTPLIFTCVDDVIAWHSQLGGQSQSRGPDASRL